MRSLNCTNSTFPKKMTIFNLKPKPKNPVVPIEMKPKETILISDEFTLKQSSENDQLFFISETPVNSTFYKLLKILKATKTVDFITKLNFVLIKRGLFDHVETGLLKITEIPLSLLKSSDKVDYKMEYFDKNKDLEISELNVESEVLNETLRREISLKLEFYKTRRNLRDFDKINVKEKVLLVDSLSTTLRFYDTQTVSRSNTINHINSDTFCKSGDGIKVKELYDLMVMRRIIDSSFYLKCILTLIDFNSFEKSNLGNLDFDNLPFKQKQLNFKGAKASKKEYLEIINDLEQFSTSILLMENPLDLNRIIKIAFWNVDLREYLTDLFPGLKPRPIINNNDSPMYNYDYKKNITILDIETFLLIIIIDIKIQLVEQFNLQCKYDLLLHFMLNSENEINQKYQKLWRFLLYNFSKMDKFGWDFNTGFTKRKLISILMELRGQGRLFGVIGLHYKIANRKNDALFYLSRYKENLVDADFLDSNLINYDFQLDNQVNDAIKELSNEKTSSESKTPSHKAFKDRISKIHSNTFDAPLVRKVTFDQTPQIKTSGLPGFYPDTPIRPNEKLVKEAGSTPIINTTDIPGFYPKTPQKKDDLGYISPVKAYI
jgi:hypothetical protein